MTTYIRGTEGLLNDILTMLGTTTTSLWPGWEDTGTLITGIGVGDLASAETGGAAEALEDDFAPQKLPCGLHSYHFHPTGDHHFTGVDHASYSFAGDTPFSCGAWIRPNTIVSNAIIAKYDAAGTDREWKLWIGATGLLTLELYDESADTTEIAAATSALTAGQWVMVAATYDGTAAAPLIWLYVNGAAVNAGASVETGAYVSMDAGATPIMVGAAGVSATPETEFHGRIALPWITGQELTAAEVQTLYALTAPMMGIC